MNERVQQMQVLMAPLEERILKNKTSHDRELKMGETKEARSLARHIPKQLSESISILASQGALKCKDVAKKGLSHEFKLKSPLRA